jgi:mono/diheme cytochrome c family protein
MRLRKTRFAPLIVIGLLCGYAVTQNNEAGAKAHSTQSAGQLALVKRGAYIANDLAVCSQCHTPRNVEGNPDHGKWLEGAPVWLQSAQPVADWPLLAPRIAGDPPGTDAEMIQLLTTGIWRDGKPLRPPMPQFRMSVEDAQAVLAYLKSLNPQP